MPFELAPLTLFLALLAQPAGAHAEGKLYGVATLTPVERAELEGIRDKVRVCDEQFGSAEKVCDYDEVMSRIPSPKEFAEAQCEGTSPSPSLVKQYARDLLLVPGYRESREECLSRSRIMMQQYILSLRAYEDCFAAGKKRKACLGPLHRYSLKDLEYRLANAVDPADAAVVAKRRRQVYVEACYKLRGTEAELKARAQAGQLKFREAMMACRSMPEPKYGVLGSVAAFFTTSPRVECFARANGEGARQAERAHQERRDLDRCLDGAPPAPPATPSEQREATGAADDDGEASGAQ